jgi:hypothetical protein
MRKVKLFVACQPQAVRIFFLSPNTVCGLPAISSDHFFSKSKHCLWPASQPQAVRIFFSKSKHCLWPASFKFAYRLFEKYAVRKFIVCPNRC